MTDAESLTLSPAPQIVARDLVKTYCMGDSGHRCAAGH